LPSANQSDKQEVSPGPGVISIQLVDHKVILKVGSEHLAVAMIVRFYEKDYF